MTDKTTTGLTAATVAAATDLFYAVIGGNSRKIALSGTFNFGAVALGGATIGSNALAVTGTASISGALTLGTSGILVGGTNLIEQRNGTAAQAFNLYNTYTDASNYERAAFAWNSNRLDIGPQAAGTGTLRSIGLLSHVLFPTDNTYDIGASGATRPRDGFFAGSITAGGQITSGGFTSTTGNYNVLNTGAVVWIGRSIIRSPNDGVLSLANQAETDFGRLQFGGTTNAFPAIKRVGPAIALRRADDTIGLFGDLPAAATGNAGAIYLISDGSTATWGATCAGGGANQVLIWSNGTNWTVIGV